MSEDVKTTHKSVKERYLFKAMYGSSHWWAHNQIKALGNLESALDVGPGSGVFGKILGDSGCKLIDAIEIDADTRNELSPVYTHIVADLSELEVKSYDLILLLDVLEHMADPFTYLREVSKRLNPGGHILISLPNIAHWAVRVPLLFGFFEYTQRGLLDQTHLQFFNRRRALKLAKEALACERRSYHVSIEPAELALPKVLTNNSVYNFLSQLRFKLAQFLPGLLGYQHLLCLEKSQK